MEIIELIGLLFNVFGGLIIIIYSPKHYDEIEGGTAFEEEYSTIEKLNKIIKYGMWMFIVGASLQIIAKICEIYG